MANTFTQIHIQFVFAAKKRDALIENSWQEKLHQYITGIFQCNRHRMIQINSMPDHIHIFIGMRPHQSKSSLIQNVKTESTKWIRNNVNSASGFAWQEGYGAFSYARTEVTTVARYIQDQQKHHKNETFLNEYKRLLTEFRIDFEHQYLFKEIL